MEENHGKGLQWLGSALFLYGVAALILKSYRPDLLPYIGGDHAQLKQFAITSVIVGAILNFVGQAKAHPKGLAGVAQYSSTLRVGGKEIYSVNSEQPAPTSAHDVSANEESEADDYDEEDVDDFEDAHPDIDSLLEQNKEWAAGKIVCDHKTTALIIWGMALFVNFFGIPVGISATKGVLRGDYGSALLYIFTLVGLGLIALAVRTTIQHRKYGTSVFELANKTGRIGGTLQGTIRASASVDASGEYVLKLTCNECITTGSGKQRRSKTRVLWEDKKQLSHSSYNALSGIPVVFDIPASCFESFDPKARGSISWNLSISAPTHGVDYEADFNVPVFKVRA